MFIHIEKSSLRCTYSKNTIPHRKSYFSSASEASSIALFWRNKLVFEYDGVNSTRLFMYGCWYDVQIGRCIYNISKFLEQAIRELPRHSGYYHAKE